MKTLWCSLSLFACSPLFSLAQDAADLLGGMGDMGGMGGIGGMDELGGDMDPDRMAQVMEMLQQQEREMGQREGGGMPDIASMFGGGMGGMGGMGEVPAEPVKSDVKLIICDTCKAMVENAATQVKALREKLPNTKIGETRIDEMLEKVCNPKEESGEWVTRYDMVESEDRKKVELVEQSGPGKCQDECKTIELACQKVYDEISQDLVEGLFFNKKSVEELQEGLCGKGLKRYKGACGKAYPKIPDTREPIGDFVLKTEEELAMDEINRKIRNTPGIGSYNPRDEL